VVNAGGPDVHRVAWSQVLDGLRRWLPFVPRATELRTVPGSVSIVDASG
jgi:hypothetical protein